MKKIILAMMACAGLCACSSDDIDLGSTQKVFESDVAYMKVNLNVNGASTRATTYSSGSTEEDAVSNAYFYFYDEAGSFVTQGEIDLSSSTDNTWTDDTSGGNIDKKSNDVVILTGLTGKGYPKYVVTVLNKPTNFTYGNTLSDMETKLAGGIYDGGTSGNFIMSTSSYTATDRTYNFVTELPNDENNSAFYTSETESTNATPVDIYVERLAAKVSLSVGSDLADGATTATINNESVSLYKLVETIAGEPNTDEASNNQVATDLYVAFTGWKLNATASDSYMMKNIDSSWSDSNTGLSWYSSENYSSNWCKSYCYNSTADNDGKILGLNYVSLSDDLQDLSSGTTVKTLYCAENTNSSVTSKGSPAITSILVKAQAYDKNESGEYEGVSLVRYNGMLFTLDAFFATIGLDKGYYADESGTTALSSTQLEISNGSISVKENQTIYAKSDGSDSYTSTEASFSDITGFDYFDGGAMYYTIPIKHVNTEATTVEEGVYGVVRNYYYNVSITGLSNLGKPISDDSEVIIPDESDTYTYYYVPADINILSWKEVTQEENL